MANSKSKKRAAFLFGFVLAGPLHGWAIAAEAPYYQGKTITILEGRSAGGTGSLRVQAVAKYLPKYLPGNPTLVFQYMPAGGGLNAANHVANSAKRDGLTIGNVSSGVFSNAIFKAPQVRYKLEEFVFLGSGNPGNPTTVAIRPALGIDSVEKLRAHKGLRFAQRAVGHSMYVRDRLLSFVVELKDPQWVLGYSEPELPLALERGEADAMFTGVPGLLREHKDLLAKGFTVPIVMKNTKGLGAEAYPEFPKARLTVDQFADTEIKKAVLRLHNAANPGGSIFFVHRETTPAALKALREAFSKLWKDRQFADEYGRMTRELADPMTAEDFEELLRNMPKDPKVLDTYKQLLAAGPVPPAR
jgi:tripartite-type tricarboxylate transporter receptor subunit TctC